MKYLNIKKALAAWQELLPLTQNFIRTLHQTLLREDYTVYRDLPGGHQTVFEILQ